MCIKKLKNVHEVCTNHSQHQVMTDLFNAIVQASSTLWLRFPAGSTKEEWQGEGNRAEEEEKQEKQSSNAPAPKPQGKGNQNMEAGTSKPKGGGGKKDKQGERLHQVGTL